MKKVLLILLVLVLVSSIVFAYNYNHQDVVPEQLTVFEFDDSEWNYVVGLGFVNDKGLELIKAQVNVERSRDYFLGEIK